MDPKKVEKVIKLVGGQFTSNLKKALASPKPSIMKRVDAAKTVEECLDVRRQAHKAHRRSLEDPLALYKAMTLSTTAHHWMQCFYETSPGSPEEILCAHMIYELLPKEAEKE